MCQPTAPIDTAVRTGASCAADTAQGMTVGDTVRWVAERTDAPFPAVPFPSRRVHVVAGEAAIRALVAAHHDRLRRSSIAHLYPRDPMRFAQAVEKAADFTVEACGGPARYTPRHGPGCMRTRHFPFTIDERARETWLEQLWHAFDEAAFPHEVRREYWEWQEAMSVRMINRRTTKAAPRRFPWHEAAGVFGETDHDGEADVFACALAGRCPRA